jgi:hypothetical protein
MQGAAGAPYPLDVADRVLMSLGAMSDALRHPAHVLRVRDRLQVRWLYAVAEPAAPGVDMVDLVAIGYRPDPGLVRHDVNRARLPVNPDLPVALGDVRAAPAAAAAVDLHTPRKQSLC